MNDEFTIVVEQPGRTAFIIAAGDVCAGDDPIHEYLEPNVNVNITIDRQEAEGLSTFLRRELGR